MLAVVMVVPKDDWWAYEKVAMKGGWMVDRKAGRMDYWKVEWTDMSLVVL